MSKQAPNQVLVDPAWRPVDDKPRKKTAKGKKEKEGRARTKSTLGKPRSDVPVGFEDFAPRSDVPVGFDDFAPRSDVPVGFEDFGPPPIDTDIPPWLTYDDIPF